MLPVSLKIFLPFIFSLFNSSLLFKAEDKKPANDFKWAVGSMSTLKVSGKSNVNSFTCAITSYRGPDTLYCEDDRGSGKPVRLKGVLEINMNQFDCKNKMITNDFRKTVRVKEDPNLQVRFLSLSQLPSFGKNAQCIKGMVEVKLAGVAKIVEIQYGFVKSEGDSFTMTGKTSFCFSDFQLSPPKKLAGIIVIEDEFTVEFNLALSLVS